MGEITLSDSDIIDIGNQPANKELHYISTLLHKTSSYIIIKFHCHHPSHLPEYGMLHIELISSAKRKEELAAVVIEATVGHGYQASPSELEALVELILHKKTPKEHVFEKSR